MVRSRKVGRKRCSRCGAEIVYMKDANGKTLMMDARPSWVKTVDGGKLDFYGASGKKRMVRLAKRDEPGAWLGYREHSKTCSNPITLREIRAREAAKPIKRAPAAKIEQARRRVEYPQAETIRLF